MRIFRGPFDASESESLTAWLFGALLLLIALRGVLFGGLNRGELDAQELISSTESWTISSGTCHLEELEGAASTKSRLLGALEFVSGLLQVSSKGDFFFVASPEVQKIFDA